MMLGGMAQERLGLQVVQRKLADMAAISHALHAQCYCVLSCVPLLTRAILQPINQRLRGRMLVQCGGCGKESKRERNTCGDAGTRDKQKRRRGAGKRNNACRPAA